MERLAECEERNRRNGDCDRDRSEELREADDRSGDDEIVVEGRVTQGGLALGAERGTTCLGNSFFSADQWRGRRDQTLMVRPLRLANRQTVRVVLSNWVYPDGASTWQIRRVYIRSLSLPEK